MYIYVSGHFLWCLLNASRRAACSNLYDVKCHLEHKVISKKTMHRKLEESHQWHVHAHVWSTTKK